MAVENTSNACHKNECCLLKHNFLFSNLGPNKTSESILSIDILHTTFGREDAQQNIHQIK